MVFPTSLLFLSWLLFWRNPNAQMRYWDRSRLAERESCKEALGCKGVVVKTVSEKMHNFFCVLWRRKEHYLIFLIALFFL